MTSTVWVCGIVVASIFLLVANINYPIARNKEERRELAITAERILEPELKFNLEVAKRLKEGWLRNYESLDTGAWVAISNGNLLLGIESGERESLIKAYSLTNKVNEYHNKILGLHIPQGVIIPGSTPNDCDKLGPLNAIMEKTLDDLIPLLVYLTEQLEEVKK